MKKLSVFLLVAVMHTSLFGQWIYDQKGNRIEINDFIDQNSQIPTLYLTWDKECTGCLESFQYLNEQKQAWSRNGDYNVILVNVDILPNNALDDKVDTNALTKHLNFITQLMKTKGITFQQIYYPFSENGDGFLSENGAGITFFGGPIMEYVTRSKVYTEKVFTYYIMLHVKMIQDSYLSVCYFDENWLRTTEENASFKRTIQQTDQGLWQLKDYWMSGELQMDATFKDRWGNMAEGESKYYFKSGKIQYDYVYVEGYLHGSYKEYYENGQLKMEGNYWEDDKDSVWTYYDQMGNETKSELWERGFKVKLSNN